jgi:hypothetical protein
MYTIPSAHQNYVIRFWQEQNAQRSLASAWRFTLENLDTGTSLDFNSLAEILTFLEAQAKLIESTHLGVDRRVIDG